MTFDDLIAAVMKEDLACIRAYEGDVNELACTTSRDWWTPELPPPASGYRALCVATAENKVRSAEALIAKGANLSLPDGNGMTPPGIAEALGRSELQTLYEKR